MFKFEFSSEDKEADKTEEISDANVNWNKSEEIVVAEDSSLIKNILENTKVDTIKVGNVEIKYLFSTQVLKILQTEQTVSEIAALKADQSHSDLLPAIYEGGLKIWECTYDLLNYIDDEKLDFENKNVLDLGCGAGIVGILTLLKRSSCTFQDYNTDVIQYITAPNVLVNAKDKLGKCKFYSGDWQSFSELLEGCITDEEKFDYIFTSETIYNTENYAKLHRVFEKLLKRSGVIFLAAKSFYFGVGGGISLFKDFLDRQNVFKHSSCWECAYGIKRQILKIEFIS